MYLFVCCTLLFSKLWFRFEFIIHLKCLHCYLIVIFFSCFARRCNNVLFKPDSLINLLLLWGGERKNANVCTNRNTLKPDDLNINLIISTLWLWSMTSITRKLFSLRFSIAHILFFLLCFQLNLLDIRYCLWNCFILFWIGYGK